jgi:hypothetical protein
MSSIQRYTYRTATTVLGGQHVCNLDHLRAPFLASVLVDVVTGAASYAIEFTLDNMDLDPADFRWITVPNLPAGQTTTQLYKLDFNVTAVRLNIQSLTGEVRLSVAQGIGTTI